MNRPLVVVGAGSLLTLLAAASPLLLRHFDAFRVRRVEVVGAHLLPAKEALALSGITDSLSVFDDFDPLRERLLGHRLIADVRLQRRLPATLRILVTETEAVALVQGTVLRAVDARGRLLPVVVAGAALDVPILPGSASFVGADSVLASPLRAVVETLDRIRHLDADLAASVSEAGPAAGGGVRLVMDWPGQPEVLLGMRPQAGTLWRIHAVLGHVRAAPGDSTGVHPADRLGRVDARYSDEVFVSYHSR